MLMKEIDVMDYVVFFKYPYIIQINAYLFMYETNHQI